jgi:hypothetical protein
MDTEQSLTSITDLSPTSEFWFYCTVGEAFLKNRLSEAQKKRPCFVFCSERRNYAYSKLVFICLFTWLNLVLVQCIFLQDFLIFFNFIPFIWLWNTVFYSWGRTYVLKGSLIVWHIDSLLENCREISKYTTAVTEQRFRKQTCCHANNWTTTMRSCVFFAIRAEML